MGNVVKASEVANFLQSGLIGEDIVINSASSLDNVKKNSLTFTKGKNLNIIDCGELLMLTPLDFDIQEINISIIRVKNPRLAFAKVIDRFLVSKSVGSQDNSSKIGEGCKIDATVNIGPYCIIGRNVVIGEGTTINQFVVIADNTIIGKDCYIKSGSVIGEDGFGFDFEDNGVPVRIPHLGAVVIGNNVEIGAKNTIARGTLNNTIIENSVKTDDQVHIGHNCIIGKNSILTACVEISGSVRVGEGCWFGPNSSVIQKISIGRNVKVGIGTLVTNSIPCNKKVMNLEGLGLKELLQFKKEVKWNK